MKNKKIKVVHIMSDGKVLDSIDGVVIPLTPETLPAYKLLAEFNLKEWHDSETKKGKFQTCNDKL